MRDLRFAQELVDLVVSQLRNDRSSLRACCLLSKTWRIAAQPHLFKLVKLSPNSLMAAEAALDEDQFSDDEESEGDGSDDEEAESESDCDDEEKVFRRLVKLFGDFLITASPLIKESVKYLWISGEINDAGEPYSLRRGVLRRLVEVLPRLDTLRLDMLAVSVDEAEPMPLDSLRSLTFVMQDFTEPAVDGFLIALSLFPGLKELDFQLSDAAFSLSPTTAFSKVGAFGSQLVKVTQRQHQHEEFTRMFGPDDEIECASYDFVTGLLRHIKSSAANLTPLRNLDVEAIFPLDMDVDPSELLEELGSGLHHLVLRTSWGDTDSLIGE